jgi:S-DNA-T family DNA segregation ATPase FtsK/SpoIIIE
LAFLLIDFKGGAAFSELARLPHTAGLLTNLGAHPHEVDRLCASLRAERHRRQRTLRAAGVDDIEAYRSRASDSRAEQLPRLLVVVDEYAELIEQSPDMLDVLTSFARLGRSLGIHLVLSSQRVDDGRLRGLDAHLRFRICLRTFAIAESLAAIGSPVAAQLPPTPGLAWLRQDDRLTRLHTALVGDPAAAVDAVISELASKRDARPTPMEPVRSICPPPLPDALSLARPAAVGSGGTASRAVVGLTDLPESGVQQPLVLDLTGTAGHLAVVGAPRSGRSTALATAVAALACATSASELAVHVVTSAGSVLAGVAGLPHVGTVATTAELAEQVIRAVAGVVAERRAAQPQRTSRVVLVVDDLATLLAEEDIAAQLATVASQGLAVNVSLAVSCSRWSELRSGIREAIGSRWELRLNDPSESLQPSAARRLPERPPGRTLTEEGRWAQLALPRADGRNSPEGVPQALADLVAAVARRGGPATRPVQLLPRRVPAHALPRPSQPGSFPIGVHGPYAEPVEVGLRPGEHLVVLGNSGSGRSGFLRAVADASLWWQGRPWFVDPRGTLHAGTSRVARTATQVAALTAELVGSLRGVSSADSDRAWQLLIVDDLDLLATRSDGLALLSPLLEVLPYAADIGLSVVASRRLSGFTKAAFDPFFGQLLDLCETAIVLSGDPSEGIVVGGIRPHPQPPGRGQLVQRGQRFGEVQLAWLDAAEGPAAPVAEPRASATKPRRDGA